MTTPNKLATIPAVDIPLPDWFRPADFQRLKAALTKRSVYGYTNPSLNNKNFPKVVIESCSHRFVNFWENGEKFRATLEILDTPAGKQLLSALNPSSGNTFSVRRRMNNDPWRLGNENNNAPGFFAIDIQLGKQP